jgi:hypothetical protein
MNSQWDCCGKEIRHDRLGKQQALKNMTVSGDETQGTKETA